ncbi:MAG: hypothetical protein RR107_00725 [Clostridia bacterium]
MKSVMKIGLGSFVIVGTVIGAGFASGREILVFFGKDAKNILFLFVTLFCSLFFLSLYFMSIGKRAKINCAKDMLTIKNATAKNAVASILAATFLVSTSSMLAGIDEIAKTTFGLSLPFASIASFFVATFFIVKGVNGLKLANSILVPVILAFIIATSVFYLNKGLDLDFSVGNGFLTTTLNAVGYSLMNILLAAVVLCKLGEGMSKCEMKFTAFFSSVIIAAVVALFLLAMTNFKNLSGVPMPIITLAEGISKNFANVSSCVIYFGIFTTLLASYYCLYEHIHSYAKSPCVSVLICFSLSFSLSRLGFANIVAYFYPIESVLAVMLLACSRKRKIQLEESAIWNI